MSKIIKSVIGRILTPEAKMFIKSIPFKNYLKGIKRIDPASSRNYGVNVIGHIRGDFGLGESCRIVASEVKNSGIPYSIINIPHIPKASETNTDWIHEEGNDYPYAVNLFHINPMELVSSIKSIPKEKISGHYNIAFWLWEMPEFPPEWDFIIEPFDEIWTPSEFVSEAIRKRTDKKVFTIPYGIGEVKTNHEFTREYFGLPEDKYLYLMSFDGKSNFERKNPAGDIKAYRMAFPEEKQNIGIVIKATNISPEEKKFLLKEFDGYKNVYILEKTFSKTEFNSLIKACDCYISLHRAEGFGLVLAEAMKLGTLVVATRWSANVEFMDDDSALLVDAMVTELKKEYPPYHKRCHWAEPDLEDAARKIRSAFEDKENSQKLVQEASVRIADTLSTEKAAERVRKRLNEIYSRKNVNR